MTKKDFKGCLSGIVGGTLLLGLGMLFNDLIILKPRIMIMLILTLFALPVMYKLGEAHGRYNELNKWRLHDKSGQPLNRASWAIKVKQRHKEYREFWGKILTGLLLAVGLVPLFI
tara:strand:+ start:492 stop:836 length:345 start_codon:yes stop_codon:yes gene_type:complete